MELKDVILSTLAELGEESSSLEGKASVEQKYIDEHQKSVGEKRDGDESKSGCVSADRLDDERLFLEHLRERLLVLFEGFQSPNNKKIEAKIDLTLNFLEYLLATLDERIDELKKS